MVGFAGPLRSITTSWTDQVGLGAIELLIPHYMSELSALAIYCSEFCVLHSPLILE